MTPNSPEQNSEPARNRPKANPPLPLPPSLFYQQFLAEPESLKRWVWVSLWVHGGTLLFVVLVAQLLQNRYEPPMVLEADLVLAPGRLDAESVRAPQQEEIAESAPAQPEKDAAPSEEPPRPLNEAEKLAQRKRRMQEALAGVASEVRKGAGGTIEGRTVKADQVSGDLLEALFRKEVKRRVAGNLQITNRAVWFGQWRNRVVRYRIVVNSEGEIVRKEVLKGSGVAEMDRLVWEAIEKSAPFIPPSEELKAKVMRQGIVFDYSPAYDTTR